MTKTKSEATPTRVASMLNDGGRAVVTVRSRKTGRHITVKFLAKARSAETGKLISRGSRAGRVGLKDAHVVFAQDPTLDWQVGQLGSAPPACDTFRAARGADPASVWVARRVLGWAFRGEALPDADVWVQDECAICGHSLEDPVSIERGIGPECFGRITGSKRAPRNAPVAVPAAAPVPVRSQSTAESRRAARRLGVSA